MIADKPRCIALLIGTPGTAWGGMEKHCLDLATGLAARGHHMHVLAHPGYRSKFPPPIQFHPLPLNLGRSNPRLIYLVRKALTAIAPDIGHAQGNKAAKLLNWYSRKGVTRVGTVHGTKSSHQAFTRLDGVIAVSEPIHRALHHRKKCLIHNGIAPATVGPESDLTPLVPHGYRRPLILAIGRLEPVKGFDLLLKAWRQVDADGHLVIIGAGHQRQALESLRTELGLTQRVTLAGYRPDVRDWLNYADLCVISSWREGFPYTAIEALQANCPILATPVGALCELLPATSLAENHSVEALTTLLQHHLQDLDSLRRAQQSVMEQARQEFTVDTMVDRTDAFYRNVSCRA